MGFGAHMTAHNIDVSHLLQGRVGYDDCRLRGELAEILHSVHVEENLVGNSEPHMGLCPASHALDVEVVINIDVIGGAITTASSAPEREGGDEVVVNRTQRADGTRRVDDDPAGVDHISEIANNLFVARENNSSVSEASRVIDVHANLQGFC